MAVSFAGVVKVEREGARVDVFASGEHQVGVNCEDVVDVAAGGGETASLVGMSHYVPIFENAEAEVG